MNNLTPEEQERNQKVIGIVSSAKDAVLAGWQKMAKLTTTTDFLAILEPGEQDTSILILTRESGLAMLAEKGCDIAHPSLKVLEEAATGLSPTSSALWIVVLFDGRTHVSKMVHQPMPHAGSA
jgi:hypothetical protein